MKLARAALFISLVTPCSSPARGPADVIRTTGLDLDPRRAAELATTSDDHAGDVAPAGTTWSVSWTEI